MEASAPTALDWRGWALSVGLALLVLTGTLVGVRDNVYVVLPPETPAECLIFVAAIGTLIARTLPYAALAIATVVDALPHWLPIGGAGYHLSFMIAVYFVTALRPTRRALPIIAAVLLLQVGLMAQSVEWHWSSMFVVTTLLTICLPAALGLAARARAQTAEALRERAEHAERSREADAHKLVAEDRLRTARDLHDSVAHQIAVMNLNAGVASRALRSRPDEAESALVTVREAGRAVIASISDLLTDLRDRDADSAEPHYTWGDLRSLLEEFSHLFPDLEVHVDGCAPGAAAPVADNDPVGEVLYSVVREGLTNAYKHGRHDAQVHLNARRVPGAWELQVLNEPDANGARRSDGFGLQGMRERVVAVGGLISIDRSDDRFVLRARIPDESSHR